MALGANGGEDGPLRGQRPATSSPIPQIPLKRIVLCRPLGPRNVGSVLRVVANFGPAEIVLVRPVRPALLLHPDFTQMAHGVEDIAGKVRRVESLEEAIADCTRAYGFTARARDHRELVDWREAQGGLIETCHRDGERVALVFGSEENGLTGEETDPLQELIRFPTSSEHTSLNLAMSVGLVMSTIFFADAPRADAPSARPITGQAREYLSARLMDALGGLTSSEPAKRDLAASVERIFSRAPLETRDARAWHLLAQAVAGKRRPADYGLEEGFEV